MGVEARLHLRHGPITRWTISAAVTGIPISLPEPRRHAEPDTGRRNSTTGGPSAVTPAAGIETRIGKGSGNPYRRV